MKITILGSLGNIGKPLTKKLIASGNQITVISSNADRTEAIETLGAKAAIGSVSDAAFLKSTFAETDAIFALTPPNMGGSNIIENTTDAGKAIATAIKEAGIKRVVMLSSIGADLPNGTGPITGLHNIEKIYEILENVSVTFLRAGFFYTNLYNDVPMIKGAGIIGSNYAAETKIPFVHPENIATAAAEELQKTTSGKNIRYIVSDVRTPNEVAKVLGLAIDKPELPWVEFTDEQALGGMKQAGLPDEIAGLYAEMGAGLRSGKIQEDFLTNKISVDGKTKLEDFAKEFAERF
ncbi:NAD(P)H-binding protein [Flavobacterium pectinovorum]|uniref:NAD-dependent dehydratase n=1 Tax=Flavobacterium pectinovorum TaxID=29533 RepID=A0A502F6Y8_9FLAO|nr:NAD(P)H-binding protein [Flavobacterium pectinovorum]TPG45179.1 NAD-dependent dehydratase [Flavobacterium pectinovorum]